MAWQTVSFGSDADRLPFLPFYLLFSPTSLANKHRAPWRRRCGVNTVPPGFVAAGRLPLRAAIARTRCPSPLPLQLRCGKHAAVAAPF